MVYLVIIEPETIIKKSTHYIYHDLNLFFLILACDITFLNASAYDTEFMNKTLSKRICTFTFAHEIQERSKRFLLVVLSAI